jgi:hypothetical protein
MTRTKRQELSEKLSELDMATKCDLYNEAETFTELNPSMYAGITQYVYEKLFIDTESKYYQPTQ